MLLVTWSTLVFYQIERSDLLLLLLLQSCIRRACLFLDYPVTPGLSIDWSLGLQWWPPESGVWDTPPFKARYAMGQCPWKPPTLGFICYQGGYVGMDPIQFPWALFEIWRLICVTLKKLSKDDLKMKNIYMLKVVLESEGSHLGGSIF